METLCSKGLYGFDGARGEGGEQPPADAGENKGSYEELPVDAGQQGEIDDILGTAPKKQEVKDVDEKELLEHFEDKKGGEEGGGKEEKEKEPDKAGGKEAGKEVADDDEDPTIVAMREQILKLSAELDAAKSGKPVPPAKKEEGAEKGEKEEKEEPPAKQPPLGPIDLKTLGIEIDDATYDKMFESKEVFHEVLGKIAAKTSEETGKRILMAIPKIVQNLVSVQVGMNLKAAKFFDDNKDLKPHSKFVGQVTNQIVAEHPDWDVDKVFEELPGKVRTALGIKAAAKKKDEISVKGRPAFATKGSGVRAPVKGDKEDLTPEQSQIEDMLNMK